MWHLHRTILLADLSFVKANHGQSDLVYFRHRPRKRHIIKPKNTRQCGNYICIATCSLALHSNSLELAHTRDCQKSFTLAHICLSTCWLAFAQTRSLSLPPISSHLLALVCLTAGSHLLELVHFLSNSLTRCCQTIQFSLSSFMLVFIYIHLLHSYQIL